MKSYQPGQKLKDAEEVMRALLDGQRIIGSWVYEDPERRVRASEEACQLTKGVIVNTKGEKCSPNFHAKGGWLIYTPELVK